MTKFTDSLRACLLNLEAHHDRVDGWRPSSDATPYLYNLFMRAGEVVAIDFKIDSRIWAMSSSVQSFLRHVAILFTNNRQLAALKMPANLIGIALVAEGWCLSQREEAELERVARARQIHIHPKRRENRIVVAALFAGIKTHAVVHYRRNSRVYHDVDFDGDVPEALRHLADVLLDIQSRSRG